MKRSDLSWALSSVLPHVGRNHEYTDCVGITTRDGVGYVFGTDRYTVGVARVEAATDDIDVRLSAKEAVELERFVRPSYKAEESGLLSFATRDLELHVGLERQTHRDGTTESDTTFFDAKTHRLTLDYLLDTVGELYGLPESLAGLIHAPATLERFTKAGRTDADRLTFYPRKTPLSGAAVVTVGADFVGMIAGLTDLPETATVASFLSLPQEPTKGRAA